MALGARVPRSEEYPNSSQTARLCDPPTQLVEPLRTAATSAPRNQMPVREARGREAERVSVDRTASPFGVVLVRAQAIIRIGGVANGRTVLVPADFIY